MKLYCDDLRKAPKGWHQAFTVSEAIRILATQAVEEVSLDHDISHRVSLGSLGRPFPCGETFEPVAWFLAQQAKTAVFDPAARLPKVTFHTANPIGARKMEAILADAGIASETRLGTPVNGLE